MAGVAQHPCFHNGARERGRIHLPVAPRCNIKCVFCTPTVDACFHGCRPGVSSGILTPAQAADRVDWALSRDPGLLVVGVAGPGEPLFNEGTFETFALVRERFPQLTLCVSTNGLLLPRSVGRLASLVDSLTVTVNALTVPTARLVYEHVNGSTGDGALAAFLRAQWIGIAGAVEAGLCVKVNTVYVKGRNDGEIEAIARRAARAGASIHNILQLIPGCHVTGREVPSPAEVALLRSRCRAHIDEFEGCARCRADAFVPGTGGCRSQPESRPAEKAGFSD